MYLQTQRFCEVFNCVCVYRYVCLCACLCLAFRYVQNPHDFQKNYLESIRLEQPRASYVRPPSTTFQVRPPSTTFQARSPRTTSKNNLQVRLFKHDLQVRSPRTTSKYDLQVRPFKHALPVCLPCTPSRCITQARPQSTPLHHALQERHPPFRRACPPAGVTRYTDPRTDEGPAV